MKKSLILLATAMLAAASFTGCKKGEEDPGLSLRSRAGRFEGTWKVTTAEGSTTYNYSDTDNNNNVSKTDGNTTESFDGTNLKTTDTYTTSYSPSGGNTSSTKYEVVKDGAAGTYKWTSTPSSGTGTTKTGKYTGTRTETYTFEKDGTFTLTVEETEKTTVEDVETSYKTVDTEETKTVQTSKGAWSFVSKNKSEEFKNKERVALYLRSMDETTTRTTTNEYIPTTGNPTKNTEVREDKDNYTLNNTTPDISLEIVMLKNKEMKAISKSSYDTKGSFTRTTTPSSGTGTNIKGSNTYKNESTNTITFVQD
jgi:hypothetical protein